MKSFKIFLSESQWMYHGSPHEINSLKPNRDEYMIDRAIGTHFAADQQIANKFTTGKGWEHKNNNAPKGNLYRTKVPPRSKLLIIKQKRYAGGIESDQGAIGAHISSTVFQKHPDMFKQWAKYRANGHISDETIDKIHHHLSTGKSLNSDEFGVYKSSHKHANQSFHSFMKNWDSGLIMNPHDGFRKEVVNKYLDIMKQRGIKGLVYHNTSPMETRGMPQDHYPEHSNYRKPGEKGSKKCYVIFEPGEHKLEKC